MSFTAAATTELAKLNKTVDWKFELRTNFAESTAWLEFPLRDFTYREADLTLATLAAELINEEFALSVERSKTNRAQLFAEARLTCTVGAETEFYFQGRLSENQPVDAQYSVECESWDVLQNERECEVQLEPTAVVVVSETATRQLFLLAGGKLGLTYGFESTGAGDEAFDEATHTQRRSWQAGNTQVWYDAGRTEEVAPSHYRVYLNTGCVEILENPTGKSYYASSVTAYKESAAAGATDCSAEALVAQALSYPLPKGLGLTASDYDLAATGLDIAGAYYYRGSVAGLMADLRKRLLGTLRLRYNPRTQKWELRIVTQKRGAALGEPEDLTLLHPVSIAQPRRIRDLYTRITAVGETSLPPNALALATTSATGRDSVPLGGDYFHWTKLNGGAPDSFANVKGNLVDGNANVGAGCDALPPSEGGGTTRYNSWYYFSTHDLGEPDPDTPDHLHKADTLRVVMPPSFNINAANGNQGTDDVAFWPGVRFYGSADGASWRLLTARIYGRQRPLAELTASGDDLMLRRLRYLKCECLAFKQGASNQNNPAIGLMELELLTSAEYRVSKCIYPYDHAITAVNQGAKTFTFAGAYSSDPLDPDYDPRFDWGAGDKIEIVDSTGNDGIFSVVSVATLGGNTVVEVSEAIPSATADGNLAPCYQYTTGATWRRAYPDLATRLGGGDRGKEITVGREYNEHTAHDLALQTLAESVRLFTGVSFSSVCDPRAQLHQTAVVNDELNGNLGSVLIDSITQTKTKTTVGGVNYLAEGLSNA